MKFFLGKMRPEFEICLITPRRVVQIHLRCQTIPFVRMEIYIGWLQYDGVQNAFSRILPPHRSLYSRGGSLCKWSLKDQSHKEEANRIACKKIYYDESLT